VIRRLALALLQVPGRQVVLTTCLPLSSQVQLVVSSGFAAAEIYIYISSSVYIKSARIPLFGTPLGREPVEKPQGLAFAIWLAGLAHGQCQTQAPHPRPHARQLPVSPICLLLLQGAGALGWKPGPGYQKTATRECSMRHSGWECEEGGSSRPRAPSMCKRLWGLLA
jgi:hypothetical protein